MALRDDEYAEPRRLMVAEIAAEAIFASGETGRAALDARVLEALGRVPRHEFVPVALRPYAYVNSPLPIGCDKTISQPYVCALMTDLLQPQAGDRVLEIGTGLGYQAAVLAELVHTVYSVELVEALARQARRRLARYGNVVLRTGKGTYGWPEHAPFDKIICTAAPDLIPPMLIQQLKPGGRMAIPAGLPETQKLLLVEKDAEGRAQTKEILRVRFSLLEGADNPGA
jgi:protein-L-isoaspartate(D-aspartate) O-methyltransferase